MHRFKLSFVVVVAFTSFLFEYQNTVETQRKYFSITENVQLDIYTQMGYAIAAGRFNEVLKVTAATTSLIFLLPFYNFNLNVLYFHEDFCCLVAH